ncbi:hypothetical protein [Achromobacter sp. Marseille-Q4962]|nr:hypothetical protein [Achromobacter sp. Marseille-Q4962]
MRRRSWRAAAGASRPIPTPCPSMLNLPIRLLLAALLLAAFLALTA